MGLEKSVEHSFYAVQNTESGKFFFGFNAELKSADFVDDLLDAKLFSNKYDIKLRPTEKVIEVKVQIANANITASEPFRPKRKKLATQK